MSVAAVSVCSAEPQALSEQCTSYGPDSPWLPVLQYISYFLALLVALSAIFMDGAFDKSKRRFTRIGALIVAVTVLAGLATALYTDKQSDADKAKTEAVNRCLRELADKEQHVIRQGEVLASAQAESLKQSQELAIAQATAIANGKSLATAIARADVVLKGAKSGIDTTLGETRTISKTAGNILDSAAELLYPFNSATATADVEFEPNDPALGRWGDHIRAYLREHGSYDFGSSPALEIGRDGKPLRAVPFRVLAVALDVYDARGKNVEFEVSADLQRESLNCSIEGCSLMDFGIPRRPVSYSGRPIRSILELRGRLADLYFHLSPDNVLSTDADLRPTHIFMTLYIGNQHYEFCGDKMTRARHQGRNVFSIAFPKSTEAVLRYLQPSRATQNCPFLLYPNDYY